MFETGIPVVLQLVPNIDQLFIRAATAGTGPDVALGQYCLINQLPECAAAVNLAGSRTPRDRRGYEVCVCAFCIQNKIFAADAVVPSDVLQKGYTGRARA